MSKIVLFFILISIISCSTIETKNDYRVSKEVVVTGRILNSNLQKDQVRVIAENLGLDSDRYYPEVDHEGFFKVTFQTYLPQDSRFSYGNVNFLFLAFPGDSIHIEYDARNKEGVLDAITFSGDRAESNKKVVKFQVMTNYNNAAYSKEVSQAKKELDPIAFSKLMDSVHASQLQIYNDFIKEEQPNETVKSWAFHNCQEPYNYAMFRYSSEYGTGNDVHVPLEFYDFQTKYLPLKEKELISANYLGQFLNQFGGGYIRERILKEYEQEIKDTPESLDWGSIYINEIIKYTKDPLLKQLLLTAVISEKLGMKDISIYEDHVALISKNITKPYLIKPLREKYVVVKKELQNPKLASDALFLEMEGTDVASKINSIRSINKGKIIYFDFWGPNCKPCVAEMPHSKRLMETLKGKDVAFVYLCINSDTNKAKAKLSELQLGGQHYFFNKKQSVELQKIFKVQGVPRYMLINQEGVLIDQNAKRPSDPKLKEELLELLS
tara:strand:+ start:5258 stop:6742 length:1485 start_codon:yes stop_codon:yes gene_type:complete